MSHGYAIGSALSGLATSAFTWSSGYTTGVARLNDGIQDEVAAGSSSTQASGQTLKMDLGASTSLAGFALLSHNLATGSCTVKVEGADDSGFTTNVVTAKAATTIVTTAPNNLDTVLQFPATARRWWRLTFTHVGLKTVRLGEVLALTAITALTRTKAYGYGEVERFIQNRTESYTGSIRATLLSGPIRTKRFAFKDLVGTSQRDELMTMWRATSGGVLSLLWVETLESTATAGSAASQECVWGKLSESHGWTETDFNLFDVDGFELTGLGREVS